MSQISKLIKEVNKKVKTFDTKLKTSFILIRQDLDDMQIIIDAMRKYLKKKDNEYERQNKHTTKTQVQIQEDTKEFETKIAQLELALSQLSTIKSEIVTRKDLTKIENQIKESFKKEIEKYKAEAVCVKEQLKESNKRIKALENGIVHVPKKSWFSKN